MPKMLYTISTPERNIASDGIYTFDLAVNPLSVIMINLRPLNDTGTLANFVTYRDALACMNRLSVMFRGESIVSMKGEDLAAMLYFRHGIQPYQGMHRNVNNERRCICAPVLMGRHAFDPKSCFPASRRGELVLELDLDIADTGYDTLNVSVDTIELLDAKPSEYEKKVSVSQTWAATGDSDIDLPPGNVNRGLLLFGTTGFTGASPAPSWGRIKTLLDNREVGFGQIDFEVAQALHCLWGRQPPTYDAHKHVVTTDGNAQTEVATLAGVYDIGVGYHQYAYLDFDPLADDVYSLDTRGSSRFHVRATAETADAVRVIPVEVIKV